MRRRRPPLPNEDYDNVVRKEIVGCPDTSMARLAGKVLALRRLRGYRWSGALDRAQAFGIVLGSLRRLAAAGLLPDILPAELRHVVRTMKEGAP